MKQWLNKRSLSYLMNLHKISGYFWTTVHLNSSSSRMLFYSKSSKNFSLRSINNNKMSTQLNSKMKCSHRESNNIGILRSNWRNPPYFQSSTHNNKTPLVRIPIGLGMTSLRLKKEELSILRKDEALWGKDRHKDWRKWE